MNAGTRTIPPLFLFFALATAQTAPNWTRLSPSTSPPAREDMAAAYDSGHGEVVLFGGSPNSLVVFNDTWVWNGSNWTLKSPGTSPPGRTFSSMVYDSARGEIVLFGGMVGGVGVDNDTWVWNGEDWTKKNPGASPPARAYHAMAFDAAHSQVVLFGGSGNTTGNDTWVWNGSIWTQKFPPISPPARSMHAMAYDSGHGQVVLFGGSPEGSGATGNDTWVWDGSTWTQKIPVNNPPARSRIDNAMVYDSSHGQVVLFGGLSTSTGNVLNDTWVWDGSNWTMESPPTMPQQRYYTGMAYDFGQNQTILFGGTNGDLEFADTWTFTGGTEQPPTVTAVANGASFVNGGVVPGEIASLFGTNLTAFAGINLTSSLPLPNTFLGDTVIVNAVAAPLFAVDNVNGLQQINFQVPWEAAGGPNATIVVQSGGGTSASFSVAVLAAQPGIFNYSSGGATFGQILHANFKLANTANPAIPGEIVLIYCTGLGAVTSAPADGAAGNGQSTIDTPTVTIGGLNALVSFSGLAPGLVGLYQINAEVPTGAVAGNQQVVVTQAGASSNSVLLPVQ